MAKKPKVSERRIRQILSVIVAALLIGSISYLGVKYFNASKAATTADTIFITPSQSSWTQGANVSVTVQEDSGQAAISAAQFLLNYDPSQLQYTGLSEGGQFEFVAPQAPTCTPLDSCKTDAGSIRIMRGMKGADTLTGPHAIVTLNFKVLASSGTTKLTLDPANSIISQLDGTNVLTGVGNGSFVVSPAVIHDAVFSLTPSSGNVTAGSTITLTLHLSSPTQKVYSTHAVVTYPADLVQYLSINPAADPFPTDIATTTSAGTLDIARGIGFGIGGWMGSDGVVAVMNFKVLGSSGNIHFDIRRSQTVSQDSGAISGSGDNLLGTINAANLTIAASSNGGNPGSDGNPGGGGNQGDGGDDSAGSHQTPVYTGSTKLKSSYGGSVTLNGNSAQLQGSVNLAPVPDAQILARNPGDSIVKVEYYLDGKLIATKTAAPFSYTFDSKKLRNGSYEMKIVTHYKSGAVDSQTQKLLVKNPITIPYIMVHYGTGIVGSIAGLLIVAFLLWRYVWPRFGGNGPAYEYAGSYNGPDATPTYDTYVAPTADIITPTALPDKPAEAAPAIAVAEETKPLAIEKTQSVATTLVPAAPPSPVPSPAPDTEIVTPAPVQPSVPVQPVPEAAAKPEAAKPVAPAKPPLSTPPGAAPATPKTPSPPQAPPGPSTPSQPPTQLPPTSPTAPTK